MPGPTVIVLSECASKEYQLLPSVILLSRGVKNNTRTIMALQTAKRDLRKRMRGVFENLSSASIIQQCMLILSGVIRGGCYAR